MFVVLGYWWLCLLLVLVVLVVGLVSVGGGRGVDGGDVWLWMYLM